ncbi:MAG TPA: hypothetical protein VJ873_13300 [bacterium]|nr:hypothetical protein [bacterium]
MLTLAVGLFAVAAVGGLTLATLHFKKKNLPLPLALLHGLLGAAGLVVLLVAILHGGTPAKATYAIILFAVAAVGGFYLFSFHLRKKALPSTVVVIHALVAVAAFACLLVATFMGV